MKNNISLILLISCVSVVSVPTMGICKETTCREGIFQVSLPATWTRLPDQMLDEMKKTMIEGGRELAEASKSADPNDISEKTIPFVSGFQFQTDNRRILLVFAGVSSPIIMDRDVMYKTNDERVKWGIDTGRLKKTSKGVSKLDINDVPCLLQDIETTEGGRMMMYSFFVSEHPKMMYSVQIICDDPNIYDKCANDIASIIKSLKVVREVTLPEGSKNGAK